MRPSATGRPSCCQSWATSCASIVTTVAAGAVQAGMSMRRISRFRALASEDISPELLIRHQATPLSGVDYGASQTSVSEPS